MGAMEWTAFVVTPTDDGDRLLTEGLVSAQRVTSQLGDDEAPLED